MLKVIEQLFNVFFSSLSLQSFHSIYFCHGTNSVDFFCWLSLPPSCIKTRGREGGIYGDKNFEWGFE